VLKKFAEGSSANPVVFSFFRDGCCFPVLLIAAALIEGGCKFPKSSKELGVFCLLGVTGMWGNQLFYILGLYFTSATIASCWQPAIPVFAAFFAIILRVEPFPPLGKCRGWLKLLGILCAAGGALVLTLGKPKHGSTEAELKERTLGNLFLFANCSCMALCVRPSCTALTRCRTAGCNAHLTTVPVARLVCRYINIQKVFIFRNDKEPGDVGSIWKPHPVHITAWSYFFGAIAMIITAVVGFYAELGFLKFGKGDPEASFNVPKPMFVGLAYAVFISSGAFALRFVLWTRWEVFRIDGGSNQPLDSPG
jgi:drug/metabolite transporter (DMT)-like permease